MEEKAGAYLPGGMLEQLADTKWKERLEACEKFKSVRPLCQSTYGELMIDGSSEGGPLGHCVHSQYSAESVEQLTNSVLNNGILVVTSLQQLECHLCYRQCLQHISLVITIALTQLLSSIT